jgi:hypothetical protein
MIKFTILLDSVDRADHYHNSFCLVEVTRHFLDILAQLVDAHKDVKLPNPRVSTEMEGVKVWFSRKPIACDLDLSIYSDDNYNAAEEAHDNVRLEVNYEHLEIIGGSGMLQSSGFRFDQLLGLLDIKKEEAPLLLYPRLKYSQDLLAEIWAKQLLKGE